MMFRGVEDVPEGARGAIAPIEDFENAEEFGINSIDGFTWRQIFDLDACTRCGRCQDLCPAYNTEKPLSPKQFIQDLKAEWERHCAGVKNEDGIDRYDHPGRDPVVVHRLFACQVNCPYPSRPSQKHRDEALLTLTLSKTTSETKLLFKNLQKNNNPYGMGKKERLGWTEGLEVRNAMEQEVEYLYWVGCVASLDDRNRKVARAFATILNQAGVNFGILGTDEMCCGDPSRRCGNEEQYLGTAQGNVELLNEIGIKKIITTCPHCYTTIKKEYAQLGGNFEVYHQAEFINKLIGEGKLKLNPALEGKVTLHDPCYLGRVNGIFDQPATSSARSAKVFTRKWAGTTTELLLRRRRRGYGWMNTTRGSTMQDRRGHRDRGQHVVTACPYCLIMMEDAIKDKEKIET
jgi:Fe-S oxidoreductase